MVLIRECFHNRTPSDLLYDLEWWEVLSCYNRIVAELNKRNEPMKRENKNTKLEDYWHEDGNPKSDYAKEMKEKILRGDY